MDLSEYGVKMRIDHRGTSYVLLSMYENALLPRESVSNLIAADQNSKIVWIAEPPRTKYDIYWKIYFEGDHLFAVSGAGELHEIDPKTGRILSSKMTK